MSPISFTNFRSKDFEVAGETFRFFSGRALYWEKRNLLVLSDLHLGKAETFLQNGLWLPAEAQHEDLARIKNLVDQTSSKHLLILGDLIHTKNGMTDELIRDFRNFQMDLGIEITVTTGNHDRNFFSKFWPTEWAGINAVESLIYDEILFQHEPGGAIESGICKYAWYGHLHPAVRMDDGVLKTRMPCFYLKKNEGYLPAFSSLAGGETIHPGRGETVLPTDLNENWIGLLKRSQS